MNIKTSTRSFEDSLQIVRGEGKQLEPSVIYSYDSTIYLLMALTLTHTQLYLIWKGGTFTTPKFQILFYSHR